jgi:serine/threonine protein phosphatase PrpC
MKTANKSDIGRIRMVNEDRALVQDGLNGVTLAIVADGMGGHQAGDKASQTAIEVIQQHLQAVHRDLPVEECEMLLKEAVYKANDSIFRLAAQEESLHGMGTTVVTAVAWEDRLIIAHIGDSRAYLLNKGQFLQLTEDHSLVNELVKNGQISPDEADHHPRRNVLTRALGTDAHVQVDLKQVAWEKNDLLLLCTDGLSALVDPLTIQGVLRSEGDLERKVNQLVQRALEAGGDDNITVVLLANEQEVKGKGGEA